ncbi:unnamed protein product [Protopolystoma xenopodis]|uniref:Uncharacterized protein n=1 Tax=Protopolystoma xenopodis TaxID=117903 RepID=A0A3S5CR93_9PLAT|nr:unnamed protein product [Protopolystoma xenopodis]
MAHSRENSDLRDEKLQELEETISNQKNLIDSLMSDRESLSKLRAELTSFKSAAITRLVQSSHLIEQLRSERSRVQALEAASLSSARQHEVINASLEVSL